MLSGAKRISKPIISMALRGFATAIHTPVCVIGAGCGGINVTAQLIRKGVLKHHIRMFDPMKYHHYQPGWTMIGGGLVAPTKVISTNDRMIPRGVPWIDLEVVRIDPDNNTIETEDGSKFTYNHLVISAGIQNNYDAVKGLSEALEDPNAPVATIYNAKSAQKWSRLRENFQGGNAVFTFPPMPVKCAGAPQKIMHLSHDTWVNKKKLNPKISYYAAPPTIFSQPDYAKQLMQLATSKGINVNLEHNLIEVRSRDRVAVIRDLKNGRDVEVPFDVLHVAPPQRPQAFLLNNKTLVNEAGYVDVHPNTLRSTRYNNVWALGDCTNLPTSKTAAAVMGQTPVLVDNLVNVLKGTTYGTMAAYQGYTSCPIFVGKDKLLLAEFKYALEKDETFGPLNKAPRSVFFYMKKYLFPFAYFRLMPKGIWFGRYGLYKPTFPVIKDEQVQTK